MYPHIHTVGRGVCMFLELGVRSMEPSESAYLYLGSVQRRV